MSAGKLTKMVIVGFKDPKFKFKVGGNYGTFVLQVNPTSYSFTSKTLGNKPQVRANNKQQIKSNIPDSRSLNISFYLDSTGVIPGCNDVPEAIKKFNKLCDVVNGSIHTTNYLKVFWAKGLAFPCKLDNVTITYLMFNSNGIAIRAQVNATFKEFVDPETYAAKTNSNSPDMSHLRTVKAGDSLPTMCHDIYGDVSYYLQIAEINGILNFRNLQPGQRILFPRLQK